jgi:hypothetical protein
MSWRVRDRSKVLNSATDASKVLELRTSDNARRKLNQEIFQLISEVNLDIMFINVVQMVA